MNKAKSIFFTGLLSRLSVLITSLMAEIVLLLNLFYTPAQFLVEPFRAVLFVFLTPLFGLGLFFSTRSLITAISFLRNPQKYLYRSAKTSKCDDETKQLVVKTAAKAGIPSPTILVAKNIVGPQVYGLNISQAVVSIPVDTVERFEPHEFECILMHEMYHIKEDIEYDTLRKVDRLAFNFPINLLFVSAVFFSYALAVFVFENPLSGAIDFPAVILGFAALTVLAIIYTGVETGTLISDKYLYVRELFADAYAGIITRKPYSLLSAIIKMSGVHVFSDLSYQKENSFEAKTQNYRYDAIKLSTIFFTYQSFSEHFMRMLYLGLTNNRFDEHVPLKYRWALQEKVHQLIYGKTRIEVLKPSSRYWFLRSVPEAKPEMQIPLPVVEIIEKRRPMLEGVLKYIEREKGELNLIACSEQFRIEPFEIFLSLVALIHLKIIDF